MKILIIVPIFIYCTFDLVLAQKETIIKQIIYNDLLALNEIYDGRIIQFNQNLAVVKDNDTIIHQNTITTLKDSSSSRVEIINIEDQFGFYFIEVKFNLISNSPYFGLFSEKVFKYILYERANKYYKINGFLVSEVLFTNKLKWYKKEVKRIAPDYRLNHHRFDRFIRKRNIVKIQKYLSVSVIKGINDLGFYFYDKPYVKDIISY